MRDHDELRKSPSRKSSVKFNTVVVEEIIENEIEAQIENKNQFDDEVSTLSEETIDEIPSHEARLANVNQKEVENILELLTNPKKIGNPLDKLDDHQLVDTVTELENELRHLKLESDIFHDFLKQNDPSLLEGFKPLLAFAKGIGPPPAELVAELTSRRSTRLDTGSLSSILETRGPKINLSYKIDMVTKASEDIQIKAEAFLKRNDKLRTTLEAELEEFVIRESDIKDARDIFEYNIVTQGVDKLTQRIPAEKFIKYMEDWLKSATLNIEKLRLRTASLKVHFKKVSQTLIQRQELGENVHAVDFDQLEIENKHFIEKIDQKNFHFIELKKMSGGASLILSKNKKYLQKQTEEYNDLKASLDDHQNLMDRIEDECNIVAKELEKARDRLEYLKKLKNSYTVPEVMEYINIKSELNDYRNKVNVWHRRKKIQDIALNACIRQMKNITGSSIVHQHWFMEPTSDEMSLNTYMELSKSK